MIIDSPSNEYNAPEIGWNEIELLEKIGEGHYGIIRKGICRGLLVAVKILKKNQIPEDVLISFKKEVNALCSIRSPDVCFLLGACTDPNHFCIVQEFISGGNLSAQLSLPVPFLVRMSWAQDVARGMMWMHGNRVFHRDLKLDNLMLTDKNTVKVCDLGLSDIVSGINEIRDEDGMKGTPLYAAPEVLKGDKISTKADVYSFGIILWELLFQHRAFTSHLKHNDINIFIESICDKGERPPVPPHSKPPTDEWKNDTLLALLTSCWDKKPSKRPEFKHIHETLDHIIVNGYLKDSWAINFWLVNFPGNHSVMFNEFEKALKNSKILSIINNIDYALALECLKILLAQFSGNMKCTIVTRENFGKIFDWFAPGISTNTTFLNSILNLCKQPWFYGSIQSEQASQMLQHGKYFLVRLGSIPNTFTLQTCESRSRIFHTELGYIPDGSDANYPTLQLLCDTVVIPTFQVCPVPSPFSKMFSDSYLDRSAYTPLDYVARGDTNKN